MVDLGEGPIDGFEVDGDCSGGELDDGDVVFVGGLITCGTDVVVEVEPRRCVDDGPPEELAVEFI